jgi:hypothetical protein
MPVQRQSSVLFPLQKRHPRRHSCRIPDITSFLPYMVSRAVGSSFSWGKVVETSSCRPIGHAATIFRLKPNLRLIDLYLRGQQNRSIASHTQSDFERLGRVLRRDINTEMSTGVDGLTESPRFSFFMGEIGAASARSNNSIFQISASSCDGGTFFIKGRRIFWISLPTEHTGNQTNSLLPSRIQIGTESAIKPHQNR